MEVWFIRHTQSQANAGEVTVDPALTALTARGREQAEHIPAAFERPPDLVITSPYLRAQQAAAPFVSRFPDIPRETWPVQEFTYLAYERCRGTTVTERLPMAREYWDRNDPHYVDGEWAESFGGLLERVADMWRKLREQHADKWVVIFSHAQYIRAAMWHELFDGPKVNERGMRCYRSYAAGFPIPNGAIIKCRDNGGFWFSQVLRGHIPAHLRTDGEATL